MDLVKPNKMLDRMKITTKKISMGKDIEDILRIQISSYPRRIRGFGCLLKTVEFSGNLLIN